MHRNILLFVLCFFFTHMLFAQISVRGTITDAETGEALIGANVMVVNTNIGTTADLDGNYILSVDNENLSLQFSYTGYTSQTINIGTTRIIDVALSSGEILDEVVVVGYGVQSKVKLTSAVSTINSKTLKRLPVPTVSNSLEGLASGLFVRQGSGEPGFSGSSFEIRNFGNALVIVDGSWKY